MSSILVAVCWLSAKAVARAKAANTALFTATTQQISTGTVYLSEQKSALSIYPKREK